MRERETRRQLRLTLDEIRRRQPLQGLPRGSAFPVVIPPTVNDNIPTSYYEVVCTYIPTVLLYGYLLLHPDPTYPGFKPHAANSCQCNEGTGLTGGVFWSLNPGGSSGVRRPLGYST